MMLEGRAKAVGSPLVSSPGPRLTMAQLIETACHESGHAIVSRLLDLPAGRAAIFPSGGPAWGDARFSDSRGIRSVKAILAGRAATEVLLGIADDHGNSVDDEKAVSLLEAIGFRDTVRARESLLDVTRDMVRRHRGLIAEVALRLLAEGELSGREIDELMRR
jgi:hypothetical protein